MACPTCAHTMQCLEGRWFWCPRCGSIKRDTLHVNDAKPDVIERIRDFVRMLDHTPAGRWLRDEMHKCGVLESVHVPGERRDDLG